jgi:hypothetical protein
MVLAITVVTLDGLTGQQIIFIFLDLAAMFDHVFSFDRGKITDLNKLTPNKKTLFCQINHIKHVNYVLGGF